MKYNLELQADVQNALNAEPLLLGHEFGVTSKNGIVTLSGRIDNYAKKMVAENAAKKVVGVEALVENIEVVLTNELTKTDGEIAISVLIALQTNWQIPADRVTVIVENGWVTLEGDYPWNYKKESAKNAINFLAGVRGVTNKIEVRSEAHEGAEKQAVEAAIINDELVDNRFIDVSVTGTTATLSGSVSSMDQKAEAERIALNTIGIATVLNELVVDQEYGM